MKVEKERKKGANDERKRKAREVLAIFKCRLETGAEEKNRIG